MFALLARVIAVLLRDAGRLTRSPLFSRRFCLCWRLNAPNKLRGFIYLRWSEGVFGALHGQHSESHIRAACFAGLVLDKVFGAQKTMGDCNKGTTDGVRTGPNGAGHRRDLRRYVGPSPGKVYVAGADPGFEQRGNRREWPK